ncbi:MAG: hypothetical protein V7746_05225 [Halioglobus sp.]
MIRSIAFVLIVAMNLLAVFSAQAATTGTPASDQRQKVYVTVGIIDVDAISSAEQRFTLNLYAQFRWVDPGLAHDGDSVIREQLNDIHAPRFILLNQQRSWSSLMNVVDISPDGEAIYRMRLWGDFSQIMRLQEFPLDSHIFKLPIVAVGEKADTIELLPDPEAPSFLAEQLSVADWTIGNWKAEAANIDLIHGEITKGFVFSFEAKRISRHYLIKFIIPLLLIVAMSWVVFWIDPLESASQLSVSVTSVLTLIAYHISLTGKLPDISYLTRMDLFLFGSTLLVFSSLIEVVITSRLAKSGRLVFARRIDIFSRLAFPAAYAAIGYISLISAVGASL